MIGTELFKEVSPLSSKDCFIVIERLKSTFNFPIHVHPEYELNFIEHARGAQRIVGDSVETIGDDELVLITNPKLEHAWVNHECKSQSIHEITIQFHRSSLPDELLDRSQFESIKTLFERAQKGVAFGTQAINKVRPLLKTITCETDGFYSVMKLLMILHELSLSEDTRELASHSFIHLGFAIRALIDSSQSVAEIGYACGFNNLSNFNRIFKKKKGMPPTEFRENYRKKKVIV